MRQARTVEEFRQARASLSMVSMRMHDLDPDDEVLAEEAADLDRMVVSLQSDEMSAADAKYLRYRSRHAERGRMGAVDSLSRTRREERLEREEGS